MLAYAINEQITRRLEKRRKEVMVLRTTTTRETGKKHFSFADEPLHPLAVTARRAAQFLLSKCGAADDEDFTDATGMPASQRCHFPPS